MSNQFTRYSPQSRLCVRKLLANYEIHQHPRGLVSDPASPRHSRVERSDSQDHHVGIRAQSVTHAADVLGIVLPVRVRGYHSGATRESHQRVIQASLQRSALAEVYGVMQQVHSGQFCDRIEDRRSVRPAPIIHDDYGSVADSDQRFHCIQQGLGGLISRNNNGDIRDFTAH